MIYRKHLPVPPEFENLSLVQNMQREICTWLETGANEDQIPIRPLRNQPTRSVELTRALLELFDYKCVYCEDRLEENEATVSFFRPRENATADNAAHGSRIHYVWLSWYWDNIYLSCVRCAFQKDSQFPIEGERRGTPGNYDVCQLLISEQPLLIDPCLENPSTYFYFKEDGRIYPKDGHGNKRAQTTIEILGLNRDSLVQIRAGDARSLRNHFFDVLQLFLSDLQVPVEEKVRQVQSLQSLCEAEKQFAGMRRNLLLNWIEAKLHSPDARKQETVMLSNFPWQDLTNQLRAWANEQSIKPNSVRYPCDDQPPSPSPPPPPEPDPSLEGARIDEQEARRRLGVFLRTHFDTNELDQICFELGINSQEFSPRLTPKIRELILYCERNNRLLSLLDLIEASRDFLVQELVIIREAIL